MDKSAMTTILSGIATWLFGLSDAERLAAAALVVTFISACINAYTSISRLRLEKKRHEKNCQ